MRPILNIGYFIFRPAGSSQLATRPWLLGYTIGYPDQWPHDKRSPDVFNIYTSSSLLFTLSRSSSNIVIKHNVRMDSIFANFYSCFRYVPWCERESSVLQSPVLPSTSQPPPLRIFQHESQFSAWALKCLSHFDNLSIIPNTHPKCFLSSRENWQFNIFQQDFLVDRILKYFLFLFNVEQSGNKN